MENIKEFLKSVTEFQSFASKRAEELLIGEGCECDVFVNRIEFEENQIIFEFEEKTSYYCPEHFSIEMKLEQLEMSDMQWNKFIEDITKQTLDKKEKRKNDVDKAKLEEKQKEFARLKKELGY
jgi:hypothetical protein